MQATIATYQNPLGAAAYIAKEVPHEAARNEAVQQMLHGISFQNQTVLDLGCGFGRDTHFFRQQGATAWGIDISPSLLQEAKARYGGTHWLQANLLELTTPPAQPVHFIWLCAVLVHIPAEQLPALMARWVSWLTPGGRLGLITKAGQGVRTVHNLGENLPRDMVLYQLESLTTLLTGLGCSLTLAAEFTNPVDNSPYLSLIAQRRP